jgi:putative Holliday junction resolvase
LSNPDFPSSKSESQTDTAKGRLLSLDLGTKRVGVAVSDELQLTAQPLPTLLRSNWKTLLGQISELRRSFDAQGVVIGLPLNLDGTEGAAAQEARRIARNLSLSLPVAVHLQDERLTSHAAEESLRGAGVTGRALSERVDGEAAVIILMDFITQKRQ